MKTLLKVIPRLYWFFHHLQSSDHVALFLMKPSELSRQFRKAWADKKRKIQQNNTTKSISPLEEIHFQEFILLNDKRISDKSSKKTKANTTEIFTISKYSSKSGKLRTKKAHVSSG